MPHDGHDNNDHPENGTCGSGCKPCASEDGSASKTKLPAIPNLRTDLNAAHAHHHGNHHDHSTCGHNHAPGETYGGDHGEEEHHHDDVDPNQFNHGLLKHYLPETISVGGYNINTNLTRSAALAGAAYGLPALGASTSGDMTSMILGGTAAALIAYDSTEELMVGVQNTAIKLGIAGGATVIVLASAHISAEGSMAVMAQFNQAAMDAVQTINGEIKKVVDSSVELTTQITTINTLLHANFLTGLIATTGVLAISKESHIRETTLTAMTAATLPYAAYLAIGDAGHDYGSGYIAGTFGFATVGLYGWWKMRAKISCPQHGDACGLGGSGPADTTNYVRPSYWGPRLKNLVITRPLDALTQRSKTTKKTLDQVKKSPAKKTFRLPKTREEIFSSMSAVAATGLSFGGLVMGSHEMTDNMVSISKYMNMPSQGISFIAGTGLLAPEAFIGVMSGIKARAADVSARARKEFQQINDAMVTGCSIMGIALIGGSHAILGNWFDNPIPDGYSLNILKDGWQGAQNLALLTLPIGTYWAATNICWSEYMADVENRWADRLEKSAAKLARILPKGLKAREEKFVNAVKLVSNRLRDGHNQITLPHPHEQLVMSKTSAWALLGGSAAVMAISAIPYFHKHGDGTGHWDRPVVSEQPFVFE